MKTPYIKTQSSMAVACAVLLFSASGIAFGQAAPATDRAVVGNSTGLTWKSSDGSCVRSSYGPPPESTPECDPNYKAPIAKAAPPVAAPPAPAPVAPAPIVAAPKRVEEKMSMDADALFDFNKSTLRPKGQEALDEVAAKVKHVNLDSITATGHTDRLGSPKYNQALSERRAESVKAYLVSKGVPADRIKTAGLGESQPATTAGTCKGSKSTTVVACLQADRRVDIELRGTRPAQ